MIRKNLINCKLTREKRPEKMIFKEYMDRLRPGVETCPCCGCRGKMRIHSYYGRSLVGISGDRPVKEDLCVCRLICPQCRHSTTHAILPDPIIPYRRHSLLSPHCLSGASCSAGQRDVPPPCWRSTPSAFGQSSGSVKCTGSLSAPSTAGSACSMTTGLNGRTSFPPRRQT